MRYIDVILPLPLDGTFTYSIADTLAPKVLPGIRVLVPLGRSKTYTAMALRIHDDKPDFETKEIIGIMDDTPVLLERQLKLWQWIADYYMAPLGDVYKAALPAGLKAEDGYRPKTERCVRLPENLRNENAMQLAMGMFSRARMQQKVFATYLSLSHWDTISGGAPVVPVAEVAYDELQNASNANIAVLRELVKRKFLETYEREVGRLNTTGRTHPENIPTLSEAQQQAYDGINASFQNHNVTLLHGVTSSGKTEIYIHLIAKAIDEGKQVLYLLPEIALTVQITKRLQRVFGDRLGIYHSKYSDAERVEIWKKQLSDTPYDVILGARSAVFLPFSRLGLVIIDEEHETSFKQQDPAPRYHARSAAIILAQMYDNAKVLLGTATPSMESYHNALTGKYGLVRLTTRFNDIALPEIRVIDTKDLRHRKMMNGPFSPDLLAAMRTALGEHRQVILFQNRRGFAPTTECKACGWVPKCKNCDVSLTYHRSMNMLTCHYCGYTYAVPTKCPCCESTELMGRGYGTEKIEDRISAIFPEARIARMAPRHHTLAQRLRPHNKRLRTRTHRHTHRHTDDKQGTRLRQREPRGNPRRRLHAQLPRLPRLRTRIHDDVASERKGRTQRQTRTRHAADQEQGTARDTPDRGERLRRILPRPHRRATHIPLPTLHTPHLCLSAPPRRAHSGVGSHRVRRTPAHSTGRKGARPRQARSSKSEDTEHTQDNDKTRTRHQPAQSARLPAAGADSGHGRQAQRRPHHLFRHRPLLKTPRATP